MAIINILHISDLHYDVTSQKQSDFIKVLLDDIKNNDMRHLCKFVVFSGDLVDSPTPENFEGAQTNFINALMEILELKKDLFFLVPGNHEIERDATTSSVQDTFIPMIKSYIDGKDNSDKANQDAKMIEKDLNERLKNYLLFRTSLYNNMKSPNPEIKHYINPFNSSHVYHYSNNRIGIACINSAMTSFGNSNAEKGKIYIGVEQINQLFENIKNCDIRIAVFHHPLSGSDIDSFEEVKQILYNNFHIILTGHNHKERAWAITQDEQSTYYSVSSCLYSKDIDKESEYDPSYSFITIDCDEFRGTACFRKFYSARCEFDIDLRYCRNGQKDFSVKKRKTTFHVDKRKNEVKCIPLHSPKLNMEDNEINVANNYQDAGYNIDFKGKVISNQEIENTDFSLYNLSGTHFNGCNFVNCLFTNTILEKSTFESCEFTDVKFINIGHFYVVEYFGQNNKIAVSGEGGVIVILTLNDNDKFEVDQYLYGVKGKLLSLAWKIWNEQTFIAASDSVGNVYIWKVDENKNYPEPIYCENIGKNPVYAVQWSPCGNYITSSDLSGYKLTIWQFNYNDSVPDLKNVSTLYFENNVNMHYQQILVCAWSSDSRYIVTAGIDRNICIWNIDIDSENGLKAVLRFSKEQAHSNYIRKIIWLNSYEFLTCSDDGTVKQWGLNNNSLILKKSICIKPNEGNNEVLSIIWYANEYVIAGLRDDEYAVIRWYNDVNKQPELLVTNKGHKGRIWDLSLDEKKDIIYTIGNGMIRAWRFNGVNNNYKLILLDEYTSKIWCSGMKLIKCTGLDSGEFRIQKNKDIPEAYENGTLLDFLLSKGAIK